MCDVLVTVDGIELRTIEQARRYGVAVPASAEHDHYGAGWCLCEADLGPLLARHPSTWREEATSAGFGWAEVGPDGRTWEDGFDVQTEHPRVNVLLVERSDGRRAMTLEEWERSRS